MEGQGCDPWTSSISMDRAWAKKLTEVNDLGKRPSQKCEWTCATRGTVGYLGLAPGCWEDELHWREELSAPLCSHLGPHRHLCSSLSDGLKSSPFLEKKEGRKAGRKEGRRNRGKKRRNGGRHGGREGGGRDEGREEGKKVGGRKNSSFLSVGRSPRGVPQGSALRFVLISRTVNDSLLSPHPPPCPKMDEVGYRNRFL